MKRRRHQFAIVFTASLTLLSLTGLGTARAAASFSRGFEADTSNWFPINPPADDVLRVATGSSSSSYNSGSTSAYANGVASADGAFNARSR